MKSFRKLSTAEYVEMHIKRGKLAGVLPMIAEKARATFAKLPKHEQVVRSEADLIQEGCNFTVTVAAHAFKLSKGNKFITFLYIALDNFYCDIIRAAYTEKRLAPRGVFSMDTTKVDVDGKDTALANVVKASKRAKGNSEDLIISRIDAERAFIKAYTVSSPLLRRYLIRWLLQPTPGRFKPGKDFNVAKKEFRSVVRPILSQELCETIQKDYFCRSNIANSVALRFSTQRKKTKSGYMNAEEFSIRNIISAETAYELIPLVG